jgi:2-amino-4-hydroxy-6-hydroxymethyldihydropteridine diphosphokinase
MTRAVIAFGANLGERETTIASALTELDAHEAIDVVQVSPLLETVAVRADGPDASHPSYLNGVAIVETSLTPHAVLAVLHDIESAHGRVRTERWGDRTLDLDLIVHGEHVEDGNLVVPHPRAHERRFVLEPWLDIDPDAVIPGRGRVSELLERMES